MLNKYFWIEAGAHFETREGKKGIAITYPYIEKEKNVFVGRYLEDGIAKVINCEDVIPLNINLQIDREHALELLKELESISNENLKHLTHLKSLLDTMLCVHPR